MEKIDLAIIVLGVVVVSAAIAGAAWYGGSSEPNDFEITFSTSDEDLDEVTDSIGGTGGETTLPVDVPRRNVTTATFVVTVDVSDTHLANDDVEVTVTAPDGTEGTASASLAPGGTSTSLEVEVGTASVPSSATLRAGDLDAARAMAQERFTDRNGTGTWNVTVSVSHGGTLASGSHDVTVAPTVAWYEGEVRPTVGDVGGP